MPSLATLWLGSLSAVALLLGTVPPAAPLAASLALVLAFPALTRGPRLAAVAPALVGLVQRRRLEREARAAQVRLEAGRVGPPPSEEIGAAAEALEERQDVLRTARRAAEMQPPLAPARELSVKTGCGWAGSSSPAPITSLGGSRSPGGALDWTADLSGGPDGEVPSVHGELGPAVLVGPHLLA